MKRASLPELRPQAKPAGLTLRAPRSAVEKWDQSIAAKGESPTEISILGEIGDEAWGGISAATIRNALKAAGKGPVTLLINSPGGDAFEGIAMYNLLREHPGAVTVRVLGLAASAASVVAMAGDRIEMGEGAFMMIHSAWGIVAGNRNDMREFADILDALDASMADLYSRRSGKPAADISALMEAETWMSAEAAVQAGFADAAMGDGKKKARAESRVVYASLNRPGASGPLTPKGPNMKLSEQINAFETKRAASVARQEAIQAKAMEAGRSKDVSEKEEFDTLGQEIDQIDIELADLRKLEARAAKSATSLRKVDDADGASSARGGVEVGNAVVSVKANVPKGIAFTRYVKSQIAGRGNPQLALMHAQMQKSWKDETPEVEKILMTAVAGGTGTAAGWASELVYNQNLVGEFIELLRPQTVLGKLPNLTRVPFNVRISGQDSGSSANWVGQGKGIPVSKLNTLEVTLGESKVAGLVVLTKELIRSSEPSAEMLVRNDLLKTIAEFCDRQFLDPGVAAVSNVNPASITNGVSATSPTGTALANLRADVQTLFKSFINNNDDPTTCVWIMDPVMALAISLMQNALGQPEYPTLSINGGTFFGLPVVVSNSANISGSPDSGHMIILAKTSDILFADNDGIEIDASDQASIEMTDAPANNVGTPTASAYTVSMFQTHSVAIKAVRPINWKKRRSTAVAYIKEALYVA